VLGREATIATEDVIDDVSKVLETLCSRLVSLIILLLLLLAILIRERRVKGLAEGDALEEGDALLV
jgi:hypothetical protein